MNNKQSKLFEPVTELKGVGAKTATALASLGINTIYDLLFYFPFRYFPYLRHNYPIYLGHKQKQMRPAEKKTRANAAGLA